MARAEALPGKTCRRQGRDEIMYSVAPMRWSDLAVDCAVGPGVLPLRIFELHEREREKAAFQLVNPDSDREGMLSVDMS